MEDRDTKVVTFRNHYGALMLKKSLGECCTVRAVPRALSSSCGTCAVVVDRTLEVILANAKTDLLEGVYRKEGEGYRVIHERNGEEER